MKTISKIIILVLFLSPILSQGQIKPSKSVKNKSVKIKEPSQPLVSTKLKNSIPKLKKTNIRALESAKSKIVNPKALKIDKRLLTVPSKRNYRITPKKPYDNGLRLSFYGHYSTKGFTVSPRLAGNEVNHFSRNEYFTYSGIIIFNAKANKEYRVEIELKDVHGSGKIIINDQTSSISAANNTINYIFSTTSGGEYAIALSPYERNGNVNPSDFKISSIEIDEIGD